MPWDDAMDDDTKALTRQVLPMPASPVTNTTCRRPVQGFGQQGAEQTELRFAADEFRACRDRYGRLCSRRRGGLAGAERLDGRYQAEATAADGADAALLGAVIAQCLAQRLDAA